MSQRLTALIQLMLGILVSSWAVGGMLTSNFAYPSSLCASAETGCAPLKHTPQGNRFWLCHFAFVFSALLFIPSILRAERKPAAGSFEGLNVTVPASEEELVAVVREVVDDGIIKGTREYNKDEYIAGAEAAESTTVFPRWSGDGQAFYKVRKDALDPRNFKDGGDSGTVAVRYVVRHVDAQNANLQIDALYVDDFHHRAHASNGSVESAEYTDIQDHLAKAKLRKQVAVAEQQRKEREAAAKEAQRQRQQEQLELMLARQPGESTEQQVQRLRREVERIVAPSGARLKSAPFRSASTIATLSPGAHVVIEIVTRYWYGVETQDGQHGWLHSSSLEQLP